MQTHEVYKKEDKQNTLGILVNKLVIYIFNVLIEILLTNKKPI